MLGLLACIVTLLACTPEPPATELDHAVAKESATQNPEMVDVTLYFRHGRGADAYLVPVVREVPVRAELARTALDLTLKGPTPDDPRPLQPALPPTTAIRSISVDSTTATVDLSRHVVSDAGDVGNRPAHELLALAAIANTLTEFPEIERVAVTVDGEANGRFWGAWGLPGVLFRDDSVVGTATATATLPALRTFSRRPQEVGGSQRSDAVVSRARIQPRATYLRISLELSDVDGAALTGPLPRARASRRGDDIRLSIAAEGARELVGEQDIEDPAFRSTRIDVNRDQRSVIVTVRPNRSAAFALRTLTDPTRVVLDILR